MHLIIIQLQRPKLSAFWFLVDFQVSKFLAQSIFSIRRPHNNICINASNVSSFNWLLTFVITLHPILSGKYPRSRLVVFAGIMSIYCHNFIIVGQFSMNSWLVPQKNHDASCIPFRLHTFIKVSTNSSIFPLHQYAMSLFQSNLTSNLSSHCSMSWLLSNSSKG